MSVMDSFLNSLPIVWRLSPWERRIYCACDRIRFRWPVYDVMRYFINRHSKSLYSAARDKMQPNATEQSVITRLSEDGIAMVDCEDFLPLGLFPLLPEIR